MTIPNETSGPTIDAVPAPAAPPPPPPAAPSGPPVAWAPPPSSWSPAYVDPRLGASNLQYGDVLARFGAYLADGALVGIATTILSLVLGAAGGNLHAIRYYAGPLGILYALLALAAGLAYFGWFWTRTGGATPGMRFVRLRMTRAVDGSPVGLRGALARWVALYGVVQVFGVVGVLMVSTGSLAALWSLAVDVWIFVLLVTTMRSPTRQGLHDSMAGTVVVQPAGFSGQGRAWILIALGLLGELAVVAVVLRA
jgi:uncharacterized RDD family membrane protein YckC